MTRTLPPSFLSFGRLFFFFFGWMPALLHQAQELRPRACLHPSHVVFHFPTYILAYNLLHCMMGFSLTSLRIMCLLRNSSYSALRYAIDIKVALQHLAFRQEIIARGPNHVKRDHIFVIFNKIIKKIIQVVANHFSCFYETSFLKIHLNLRKRF